MQKGANSRHVGETRLNRESSRSHSVFTCTIEKSTVSDNGLKNVITSRLNLIDLAGAAAAGLAGAGGVEGQGEAADCCCGGWACACDGRQQGPGRRIGRRRGPAHQQRH